MAHLVKRRIPLVLAAALAGALAGSLLPARAWALADDEIVPAGTWLFQSKTTTETQRDAIGRDGRRHELLNYLIPSKAVRQQVDGLIERQVSSTDLLLGLGLTDTWNLNLAVPYGEVRQESSLSTASADPAVVAAVARLPSRTVSGLGNVRLESLHRPVFDDTDALLLGWGATVGGRHPQTDYVGRTTLDVQVPNSTLDSAVHYTRYLLSLSRARVDLRAAFHLGFRTQVATPDAKGVSLHPYNLGQVEARWTQEFEALGIGLYLSHNATTQSFIEGRGQHDQTKESRLGAELLFGNLTALEQHPIALPYQVGVQVDHLMLGYNIPETTRLAVTLRLYF